VLNITRLLPCKLEAPEIEMRSVVHPCPQVITYLHSARSNFEEKRLNKAVEDLDRALAQCPGNTKFCGIVHNDKGFLLFDSNQFEKALLEFNEAIEVFPHAHRALKGRGLTYLALGKLDQSLQDLSFSLQLCPDDTKYAACAAVKLRQGRYMDALEDSNKALHLNPRNHSAYCYKGLSFCHQGGFGHALHNLSKSIEICPANFYYAYRSIVWFIQGNKKIAEEDFDRARGEEESVINELLKYFKDVITNSPNEFNAYLMRGVFYALLGDTTNMQHDLTKVLLSDNKNLHRTCYSALLRDNTNFAFCVLLNVRRNSSKHVSFEGAEGTENKIVRIDTVAGSSCTNIELINFFIVHLFYEIVSNV